MRALLFIALVSLSIGSCSDHKRVRSSATNNYIYQKNSRYDLNLRGPVKWVDTRHYKYDIDKNEYSQMLKYLHGTMGRRWFDSLGFQSYVDQSWQSPRNSSKWDAVDLYPPPDTIWRGRRKVDSRTFDERLELVKKYPIPYAEIIDPNRVSIGHLEFRNPNITPNFSKSNYHADFYEYEVENGLILKEYCYRSIDTAFVPPPYTDTIWGAANFRYQLSVKLFSYDDEGKVASHRYKGMWPNPNVNAKDFRHRFGYDFSEYTSYDAILVNYYYDESDRLTAVRVHYGYDVDLYFDYFYREDGSLLELCFGDRMGRGIRDQLFHYNEQGDIYRWEDFDFGSTPTSDHRLYYEYDHYNNWTKCRAFLDRENPDSLTIEIRRIFEYYE